MCGNLSNSRVSFRIVVHLFVCRFVVLRRSRASRFGIRLNRGVKG